MTRTDSLLIKLQRLDMFNPTRLTMRSSSHNQEERRESRTYSLNLQPSQTNQPIETRPRHNHSINVISVIQSDQRMDDWPSWNVSVSKGHPSGKRYRNSKSQDDRKMVRSTKTHEIYKWQSRSEMQPESFLLQGQRSRFSQRQIQQIGDSSPSSTQNLQNSQQLNNQNASLHNNNSQSPQPKQQLQPRYIPSPSGKQSFPSIRDISPQRITIISEEITALYDDVYDYIQEDM